MKIGLIDCDSHNFPNLALMRISAWHKSQGDTVKWYDNGFEHVDRIYISKIFSDAYSKDTDLWLNADEVYRGGTGYAIHLENGREVYEKEKDHELPDEIEKMFPDYSIYPQHDFAVSMTSRGCPRGCAFCHVAAKEGRCSKKVADVSDFYNGQKEIQVLDPNITACRDKRELFEQYIETNVWIVLNQGLDIRLLTGEDIEQLNKMKVKYLHFAWDNPKEDLTEHFKRFSKEYTGRTINGKGDKATAFVLTNFNSTLEEDLYRIYTLRDLGVDPFVMVYDKPHAPKELRRLQRWCNNKWIFRKCGRFEDYRL